MSETKIPPDAIVAEQTLLGKTLAGTIDVTDVIRRLGADGYFWLPVDSAIYQEIVWLHHHGVAVTVDSVAERLQEVDRLDDNGGRLYLEALAGFSAEDVPTSTLLAAMTAVE